MINSANDFVPYLPTLLPDLKAALLDPIPDVRGTSARALGSLTRGLGDSIMNDLRPWLIEKLGDPKCSSAERSGAANGLTEVLVAAGSDITEEAVLNDIIPLQHFPEASKREGVLWMLSYLAPALGQGFSFEWGFVPALINGLADDSDTVREVAMRAGKVLIRTHGKLHHDKILPSVSLSSNACCARSPEQESKPSNPAACRRPRGCKFDVTGSHRGLCKRKTPLSSRTPPILSGSC